MGWLGKVVGGTIGFALGGPIGAVAGAAFGHTFDKKEALYLSSGQSQQRLSTNEESQMTFFVAAFSMLAKIAKADGMVSEKEIASIEGFMSQDLNLNPESRNSAVNIFRQALNSNESFEAFAFQFHAAFSNQPRVIELMMDILLRVSAADGAISDKEEFLLLSAAGIFNLSDTDYARLKSRYVKAVNRFYSVLKIDETATNEEIKRQYRTMVSEYHPDKIEAKGLPDEFITLANDKFREIQEAYDAIRKERGI
ncbi:DjlA [Desulforapulum autotrophicum HRM2]|uniref:DjlA n=1 Tax=Desulforapulum autotrophicum (strain ATCC 43914 / DSM 3382 / VKM B-1955 / HRM2) TaxID=177437 RepID=C0QG10_DESAH|nr:TerB family tellurite resistance protein [Desulforapulum autotrophicum]ACN15578.1 DjlA [Desulforapulum autotrophicum HRM2]